MLRQMSLLVELRGTLRNDTNVFTDRIALVPYVKTNVFTGRIALVPYVKTNVFTGRIALVPCVMTQMSLQVELRWYLA